MGRLLQKSMGILRYNARTVLVFEFFYKALTYLLFYPFMSFLLDFSVGKAGLSYLSNANLGKYLRSTTTILFLLGILLLAAVVFSFEFTVLTLINEAGARKERVNLLQVLYRAFRQFPRFLHPYLLVPDAILLLFLLLMNIPFGTSLLSFSPASSTVSNNYSLHPEIYWIAAAILIPVFFLCAFLAFLRHGVLLDRLRFNAAAKRSGRLIAKNRIRLPARFFAIAALFSAAILVVYVLILAVSAFLIRTFRDPQFQVVTFLSVGRVADPFFYTVLYVVLMPLLYSIFGAIYLSESDFTASTEAASAGPMPGKRTGLVLDLFLSALFIAAVVMNFGFLRNVLFYEVGNRIRLEDTAQITAHRGSSDDAPENSMSSLMTAVDQMADYAEIDVRATKDGVPVLLHDASLKRTAGVDKKIWDVTYQELEELDAGGWYSSAYAGERIPSLSDVLDYADGKIKLNIEIKSSSESPDLVRTVVQMITDHHFENQCVITSFNYKLLSEVKEYNPEIRTGLIVTVLLGHYGQLQNVDFFSLNMLSVSRALVEKVHAKGYEIHVWGVYDPGSVRRVADMGVDNIITSRPLMAKEVMYSLDTNLIQRAIVEWVFPDTDIVLSSYPSSAFLSSL